MSPKQRLLSICVLLVGQLALPAASFGHGNNDGHDPLFDPVDTEFGSYKPGMEANRPVDVVMSDEMRFTPESIRVKQGEVIRFRHTNSGQLMHEFVLGTRASLDEHAELMKKFPNMEHSEPYMAHVKPGETAEIVWQFSKAGSFSFGCLIPGHYDAGMKGQVKVE